MVAGGYPFEQLDGLLVECVLVPYPHSNSMELKKNKKKKKLRIAPPATKGWPYIEHGLRRNIGNMMHARHRCGQVTAELHITIRRRFPATWSTRVSMDVPSGRPVIAACTGACMYLMSGTSCVGHVQLLQTGPPDARRSSWLSEARSWVRTTMCEGPDRRHP